MSKLLTALLPFLMVSSVFCARTRDSVAKQVLSTMVENQPHWNQQVLRREIRALRRKGLVSEYTIYRHMVAKYFSVTAKHRFPKKRCGKGC